MADTGGWDDGGWEDPRRDRRVPGWLVGAGWGLLGLSAVGLPVRRVRSSRRNVTSPRVADINRNCVRGSSSSGTCQAQPRSGSP